MAPPENENIVPAPDPTRATYAALDRNQVADRDYVDSHVRRLEDRFAAADRATELLAETVNRTPTLVQIEISHVRERMDLQVDGIRQQLTDAATAREREQRDKQVAVDAAFAAQKEAAYKQDESNAKAIEKSEKATSETIATNAALSRAGLLNLEVQIADLKERLARAESLRQGGKETLTGLYAMLAALATILTVGGILLAVR